MGREQENFGALTDRYQMLEIGLMLVHFEKGHMIPVTRFDPETRDRVFPLRLTLLARGYAGVGSIIVNNMSWTWIERVTREVWHRLDESGERVDDIIAPAAEVRRILIHQEHHSDIGPYSCDCSIVLENPQARHDQHVWRVES